MKDQITALQDTYAHLLDAQTAFNRFVKLSKCADTGEVGSSIAKAARVVSDLCDGVTAERDRQNDRIYGKGVLRVRMSDGLRAHFRRVTVQRPNNVCGEPYVSEACFNALKFILRSDVIKSDAGFNIAVVSAGGRKVGSIVGSK